MTGIDYRPRVMDGATRRHINGPLLPMDEPTLFERIWAWLMK